MKASEHLDIFYNDNEDDCPLVKFFINSHNPYRKNETPEVETIVVMANEKFAFANFDENRDIVGNKIFDIFKEFVKNSP